MNKRFLGNLAISMLMGASLWIGTPAVYGADEASQVLMLRRVFAASVDTWSSILEDNRKLLDKSFFERVESRIKWSIDNGQVEDAVRFAYVGDLAGKVVNRKTDYRMQMAQLFRKLGNFSLAIDLANNVCIFEPDNKEAAFYKASMLQDAGNNLDCYPIYEQLAKENYRRAECYYRMALLELERSEIEKARDHLRECVKLDPKHELAKKSLAQMEAALAKATFVPKSGSQESGIPVANLGDMPIATSNNSKALSLARQGDQALKEGSLTKAQELYTKALQLDATSPQALIGVGLLAYRQGQIEDALLSLTAAAARFPQGNADLEHYLGCCYERRYDAKGNPEDMNNARQHFLKGYKLAPDHPFLEEDLERTAKKIQRR